ncbi:hypothetical protein K4F52_003336 [Lecanicillium sp. MT-2017a]|nr:hypothetical protein K4F52_003336 [Lecanicillium sp. MT-2017a]
MDKLVSTLGGSLNKKEGESNTFMDAVDNVAGGGKKSEEQEDAVDKGVDFVQEKVFGQGQQSDETAAEQAKDEAISDAIRDKYKETTGQDFFVKDKDKKYGL